MHKDYSFHVAFAMEIKFVNELFAFPSSYFDKLQTFQISIESQSISPC